jgi:hypothetical protein
MTEDHVHIDMALSPRTIAALEPVVLRAAEDEMDSEQTQMELYNLANELQAIMQRLARQGRNPD